MPANLNNHTDQINQIGNTHRDESHSFYIPA